MHCNDNSGYGCITQCQFFNRRATCKDHMTIQFVYRPHSYELPAASLFHFRRRPDPSIETARRGSLSCIFSRPLDSGTLVLEITSYALFRDTNVSNHQVHNAAGFLVYGITNEVCVSHLQAGWCCYECNYWRQIDSPTRSFIRNDWNIVNRQGKTTIYVTYHFSRSSSQSGMIQCHRASTFLDSLQKVELLDSRVIGERQARSLPYQASYLDR